MNFFLDTREIYYVNHARKEILLKTDNFFRAFHIFKKYDWTEEDDIRMYEKDDVIYEYEKYTFLTEEYFSNLEQKKKMKDYSEAVKTNDVKLAKQISFDRDSISYEDINKEFKDGKTLLMIACENENIDMIKDLFRFKNIDLSYRNEHGKSCFTYAMMSRNKNLIDFLSEYF